MTILSRIFSWKRGEAAPTLGPTLPEGPLRAAGSHSPGDHDAVMRLALGHVASRAVYALTQLQVPDQLGFGTVAVAELARRTQTDERSLLRLLRAAAAMGLVVEEAERRFRLTGAGMTLRSDAPGHASAAAAALGGGAIWSAFGDFVESVKTGRPVYAGSIFDDMNEDAALRVSQSMIAFYGGEPEAVVEAYDFRVFGKVADIGGSSGDLLTTILRANPSLHGIVFDRPHVALHARRMIESRGVAGRCEFVGGSFFDEVPSGADAYILSHVINDWPEEKCLTILRNVRRAMPAHGRLLVVEQLITTGSDSDQAKFLDLVSLAISGGMHRTREEHAELLAKGGLRLTRVIDTRQPVSVVESEPV